MQRRTYLPVVVCLLLTLTAAQDNSGAAAASKVLALESVWNMAEEKRDVGALALIFDNSMIYIDEDGSVLTKTQFLVRVRAAGQRLQSLATHTISVHVYGGTAVVAGTYRAKGMEKGKAYQRDGRFIDTWVFKQGSWLCVVAQSTPVLR